MTPGLSETLEVQEKYAHLQEEQLDNLKDDLVSCIHGEEGQGGDVLEVTIHGDNLDFTFLMMMTNLSGIDHVEGEPPKIPLLWLYSFGFCTKCLQKHIACLS